MGIFVVLGFAFSSSAVHADTWVTLTKPPDSVPTEVLLNLSSITVKKNVRIAQTKYVPLLPWPTGAQPLDGSDFGTQFVSFNCKSLQVEIGSTTLHFSDGRQGFIDVVPSWIPAKDEFTKKMLNMVCGFNNPKFLKPSAALP